MPDPMQIKDTIQVGNIENSVVAIGQGAQAIIQYTQSVVERAREQAQEDRLKLALSIEQYTSALLARAQGTSEPYLSQYTRPQPYKSLYAYTIADAGRFYGRKEATVDLLNTIARSVLTVLHGESGAGKSSLLQASIMPQLLANSHLPIRAAIRRRTIAEEVKRTLIPELNFTPTVAKMQLRGFLHEVQQLIGEHTVIVLILDQFEVLFSPAFSDEARQADLDDLRDCIADPTLNIRIILSIRNDRFAQLTTLESDEVKPFDNHFSLAYLTLDQARAAIIEPASASDIDYEAGLIDAILNDFGTKEISPCQLQIVLNLLTERLTESQKSITRFDYEALGGVSGILSNYLNSIKNQLTAPRRQLAQTLLETLVGTEQQREAKTLDAIYQEVQSLGFNRDELQFVVDFLLRKRIIAPVQSSDVVDPYAYEIAHDYIAQQIEITPESQAKKAARELISRRLIDFKRFGSLLTPDELRLIRSQVAQLVVTSAEEKELIRKSQRQIQRRRMGRTLAGVAALVSTVVITVIYIQSEARVARADRRLADQRIEAADTAVAIQRQADSEVATATAALATLDTALNTVQTTKVAVEHEALTNALVAARLSRTRIVEIAPDPSDTLVLGSTLWIAHEEVKQVSVLDTFDLSTLAVIPISGQPNGLLFFQDQVWVSANHVLVVIDPVTYEIIHEIMVDGQAGGIVEADGKLWISNLTGVTLWNTKSNTPRRQIELPEGGHKIAFDGQHLWVSSLDNTRLVVLDANTEIVLAEFSLNDPLDTLFFDGQTIWVTQTGGTSLMAWDSQTLALTGTYEIGNGLAGFTTDGNTLWIADFFDNTVVNFDPRTGKVLARYRVGRGPVQVVFDQQHIWVLGAIDLTASVIPLQIPVPINPTQTVFQNDILWSIDQTTARCIGVNASDGAVVAEYTLESVPESLIATDVYLWLSLPDTKQLLRITPQSHTLDYMEIGEAISQITAVGDLIWGITVERQAIVSFDPNGGMMAGFYPVTGQPNLITALNNTIWATTNAPYSLVSIDTASQMRVHDLSGAPISIAPESETNLIWVGLAGLNTVEAFDQGEQVNSIRLPYEPRALVVENHHLWVGGDDRVSRFDTLIGGLQRQYLVGRGVFYMVESQHHVWLSSYTDRTIEALVK